jgi:hypothetical protein
MQQYKIDVLNYTAAQSVRSDCADITFYNTGFDNVILNSALTLTPGQSISFSANANEIDRTIYNFSFSGINNFKSIAIFRKIYI